MNPTKQGLTELSFSKVPFCFSEKVHLSPIFDKAKHSKSQLTQIINVVTKVFVAALTFKL